MVILFKGGYIRLLSITKVQGRDRESYAGIR